MFFTVSDGLVMLSTCSDAEMSRSGDFCTDNRPNQLLHPLYNSTSIQFTIQAIEAVLPYMRIGNRCLPTRIDASTRESSSTFDTGSNE